MRKIASVWLKQSNADLKAARDSREAGNFEWACFQAQQSGEKALKAFLYEKGYTSILTHTLKQLVRECMKLERDFSEVRGDARTLDMYYIPTRYPNGLGGDLAPTEFYEEEDAETCISSARSILRRVTGFLSEQEDSSES